jgi:DNA-directed RNA polymerase subunit omega
MRQQDAAIINRKSPHFPVAYAPGTYTIRPRRFSQRHPNLPIMRADLVEQARNIITEPPILINLVSKRVRQIASGRSPLVERRPGLRDADLALTEIIQGKITPENIDHS